MTFIYTPPKPHSTFETGVGTVTFQKHLYTEAQLCTEIERVRRETIEVCAKHFDAMPGREMFGDAIADEIKELLK